MQRELLEGENTGLQQQLFKESYKQVAVCDVVFCRKSSYPHEKEFLGVTDMFFVLCSIQAPSMSFNILSTVSRRRLIFLSTSNFWYQIYLFQVHDTLQFSMPILLVGMSDMVFWVSL